MLAFCSVFLVVCSTLVINQIISKGNIIFLKISESTHGEIDAFVTPAADIVGKTIDGIQYEIPALLNLTAFNTYYEKVDPTVLDDLLLAPRKVFSSTKVLKESKVGIYNETSSIQMERWHASFNPEYNLPSRRDAYSVKFTSNLDDYTIVAFKTDREKEIQVGRKYEFDSMDVGDCKLVYDEDGSAAIHGIKDGQIIFMKHGPFSFLPLVNEYEFKNPESQPIMTNTGLTERELRTREKKLINSFIYMPCRANLIESRYGKVPSTLKNAIFMEYDELPKLMAEYLPEPLD